MKMYEMLEKMNKICEKKTPTHLCSLLVLKVSIGFKSLCLYNFRIITIKIEENKPAD